MRTLFKGSRIASYFSVPSLSETLREHIRAGHPEGTIVLAREQRDNYLPPGGLWFSFFIEPVTRKEELPLIPLIAALAIVRSIENMTHLRPRIRWPKDIVFDGRKIADICCEIDQTESSAMQMQPVLISVGINTNIDLLRITENAREKMTSIREETLADVSNAGLLNMFCYEFENLYDKLYKGKNESLIEEYRGSLTTLNREVVVTSDRREVSGRAVAIEEDGSLLFRTREGKLRKVCSADVMFSGR